VFTRRRIHLSESFEKVSHETNACPRPNRERLSVSPSPKSQSLFGLSFRHEKITGSQDIRDLTRIVTKQETTWRARPSAHARQGKKAQHSAC
jgi:hypothetical protein